MPGSIGLGAGVPARGLPAGPSAQGHAARAATPARQLNGVRREIQQAIGADALRELHCESRMLDALGVLACWSIVAGLFTLLAVLPFGAAWLGCFILQGFALQALGLLAHDAFIHRRIWGDRGSWIGAAICFFPVLVRPTWYVIAHQAHHVHVGVEGDTETYKQNLDRVWKRLLFMTILGDRLAKLGRLSLTDKPPIPILPRTARERRRLRLEGYGLIGFFALVALLCVAAPGAMLWGYLLPLLIATPLASTLRVILEHAEANPDNDFHIATYYQTGFLTRLLFVADSGDCHLIHHLYSRIPWYRMAQATRLMRPVLISNGVVERRSLGELLLGWLVRGHAHRSLWVRNAATAPGP